MRNFTGLIQMLTSFTWLDALMTRFREESSRDPYAQFVATGLAYVDYALAHPARFQLMFRNDKRNFTDSRLSEAASRIDRQLEETLGMLSRNGAGGGLSLNERAALAWSIVHGFAALTLENERFAKSMGDSPQKPGPSWRRMLLASKDVFVRGH